MRAALLCALVLHAAIFGALLWLSGWEPARGMTAVFVASQYLLTLVLAIAFASIFAGDDE